MNILVFSNQVKDGTGFFVHDPFEVRCCRAKPARSGNHRLQAESVEEKTSVPERF